MAGMARTDSRAWTDLPDLQGPVEFQASKELWETLARLAPPDHKGSRGRKVTPVLRVRRGLRGPRGMRVRLLSPAQRARRVRS
jgi:hypothetical protein